MERKYELCAVSPPAAEDLGTTRTLPPAPGEEKAPAPGSKLRQYAATTAATLGALAAGTALSWPFLALSVPHELGVETDSWWTSMAAVLGAPLAGALAHMRGRKLAVASVALPFILSWVLLLATHSEGWQYAARLLVGLGLGGVFATVPVYIIEIAHDSNRGALGAILQVMFNTGVLLSYAVGSAGHYWLLNACCLVVSVVFFGAALWMPETPQFLESKGRHADAERSLRWLRGDDTQVQDLEDVSWKHTLCDTVTVRSLAISVGLVAFQQTSGFMYVTFTMETLFQMSLSSLAPSVCALVVGLLTLATSCVALLLVDRAGRKFFLILSSAVMSLTLGFLGVFYWMRGGTSHVRAVSWLPPACLAIYMAMYSMGPGPLTWTVVAELLPPGGRCLAAALVSAVGWVLFFAANMLLAAITSNVGVHYSLWLLAISCGLSAFFVAVILPETNGKSLQLIQKQLANTPTEEKKCTCH